MPPSHSPAARPHADLLPREWVVIPVNPRGAIENHLREFTPHPDTFRELLWHKWVDCTLKIQVYKKSEFLTRDF